MKIEYEKVEHNLSQAMHKMFVKTLQAGKEVAYPRAIAYLGHNIPKPNPQDTVVEALEEWRAEAARGMAEIGREPRPEGAQPAEAADFLPPPSPLKEVRSAEPLPIPPGEPFNISPLYVLRKHLLWFIRRRVANIYKLLGTTKEEIIALRQKEELTPEDQKRVNEILAKAQEINRRLLKRLGLDTDDAIIAQEQKKHQVRRFNIRDSWIPL